MRPVTLARFSSWNRHLIAFLTGQTITAVVVLKEVRQETLLYRIVTVEDDTDLLYVGGAEIGT